MFKLPYNGTHFTYQQGNAQNPPSQALAVCEPRTTIYTSWTAKDRERNQRSNFQYTLDGENMETETLFCWAPKSLWMVTAAMKLQDPCSLEEKL